MDPIVSTGQPDRRRSYSIAQSLGASCIVIEHLDGMLANGSWERIVDYQIALCPCRHDADRVVDGLRAIATL